MSERSRGKNRKEADRTRLPGLPDPLWRRDEEWQGDFALLESDPDSDPEGHKHSLYFLFMRLGAPQGSDMENLDRRRFVKQSLATAGAAAMAGPRLWGANDKIVVGVMGVGGRGTFLAQRFAERADVEQGHDSAALCHLANIAWRVGNQKLTYDGRSESFPDTPAANQFLRRASYRAPWVVPARV